MKTKAYLALIFAVVLTFGCVSYRQARDNTELIHRYFAGWANRGDAMVADKLIATNVVLHNPPNVLHSLEEYKKSMAAFHKGFPDLCYTIEEEVAEGQKIAVRWTLRATHLGEFQAHPPTSKAIVVTGTSTFQIADGKIQEIWVNMDRFGMMQQLGWLAMPQEQR